MTQATDALAAASSDLAAIARDLDVPNRKLADAAARLKVAVGMLVDDELLYEEVAERWMKR